MLLVIVIDLLKECLNGIKNGVHLVWRSISLFKSNENIQRLCFKKSKRLLSQQQIFNKVGKMVRLKLKQCNDCNELPYYNLYFNNRFIQDYCFNERFDKMFFGVAKSTLTNMAKRLKMELK